MELWSVGGMTRTLASQFIERHGDNAIKVFDDALRLFDAMRSRSGARELLRKTVAPGFVITSLPAIGERLEWHRTTQGKYRSVCGRFAVLSLTSGEWGLLDTDGDRPVSRYSTKEAAMEAALVRVHTERCTS